MKLVPTDRVAEPNNYKDLMTPLWANVFFPGTLNLLTAPMKAGKSSFMYAWAGAMVRGEPWGGIAPARPLKVAYYDLENPDAIQYSKFQNTKHNDFRVTLGAWQTEFNLADIEKDWVASGWFPDVVIVEPLIFAVNVRNENDNREMARALKGFMRFARTKYRCIILVHHDRKAQQGLGLDNPKFSSRGASALPGIVDTQMNIIEGARHRWLQVTMNRYGTDEVPGQTAYEPKFILEYDNQTKLSSGKRVLF
jgi:RecA-family ATPase